MVNTSLLVQASWDLQIPSVTELGPWPLSGQDEGAVSKLHRHLPTSPPICSASLQTQQVMASAAGPHLDPAPTSAVCGGRGQWFSPSLREKAQLSEQETGPEGSRPYHHAPESLSPWNYCGAGDTCGHAGDLWGLMIFLL